MGGNNYAYNILNRKA